MRHLSDHLSDQTLGITLPQTGKKNTIQGIAAFRMNLPWRHGGLQIPNLVDLSGTALIAVTTDCFPAMTDTRDDTGTTIEQGFIEHFIAPHCADHQNGTQPSRPLSTVGAFMYHSQKD